jgi:hypothetical protein
MGRSVTCNYHCAVSIDSRREEISFGAMKLSKIHQQSLGIAEQFNSNLVKVVVMPQTKIGERVMQKDYLIIDCKGKIDHYLIGETVPMYCF